jgi:hypothetical protein
VALLHIKLAIASLSWAENPAVAPVEARFVRNDAAAMHLNDYFPGRPGGEADGVDVRINHRPLLSPVPTDCVPSTNVAALHSVCPNNVLVDGRQHRCNIAAVRMDSAFTLHMKIMI